MTLLDHPVAELESPADGAAILRNVERLAPVIAQEAPASNAQGFMTERMGDALAQAGVYRMGFSRARGGPEVGLEGQTRVVESIARHDASIAWNATVLAATGFYACRLGPEAFDELYPHLDLATCGSFHPKATAVRVEGGYRVTGTWRFGSGIRSAHHVLGGVEVSDADGPVRKADGSVLTLGVWLPRPEVRLLDDWSTIGLRGSGSESYAVVDVFVPEHHAFDRFFAPTADADPLVKHVDLPFYSMAGISLGLAGRAIDLTTAELAARTGPRAPGERDLGLLGEAITYLRAARSLVYDGVRGIDEAIFADGEAPSDVVMARGDAPLATDFARVVVDRCSDLAGSKLIYTEQPFEQLVRDLAGIGAHASTWRRRWVDVGRTHVTEAAAS